MKKGAMFLALCIAVIVISGVELRFRDLGAKGMWNDEILIARAVRLPTLGEKFYAVYEMFGATPLLFLMELPLPQSSHPEFWARLPSAVSGALTIIAVFFLGRRLAGTAAALGAALLLAVNPFHVYFSQQARFYSLFTLLSILQMITLLRVIERPARTRWSLFFLLNVLCLYSAYYTVFLLLGEIIILLLSGHLIPGRENFRRTGLPFIISISAAFAFFLPWFVYHSSRNILAMFGPPHGFLRPVLATVQEFGPVDPMTYPLIYRESGLPGAGAILFLFFAVIGIIRALTRRDLSGYLLAVPLIISIPAVVAFETWVTSFFYRPKQVIFMLPLYLIAVSSAVCWLSSYCKTFKLPVACALFLGFLFLSTAAVQSYARREEHQGWRPAARFLLAHRAEEEPVAIHQAYYEPVFRFYYAPGAIPCDSMEKARYIEKRKGWFVTIMEHTDDPEVGEYIYRTQQLAARWQPDPEFPEIRVYRSRRAAPAPFP